MIGNNCTELLIHNVKVQYFFYKVCQELGVTSRNVFKLEICLVIYNSAQKAALNCAQSVHVHVGMTV